MAELGTTCSKSVNVKPAKTEAVSKLIHSSSPKTKIRLLACHTSGHRDSAIVIQDVDRGKSSSLPFPPPIRSSPFHVSCCFMFHSTAQNRGQRAMSHTSLYVMHIEQDTNFSIVNAFLRLGQHSWYVWLLFLSLSSASDDARFFHSAV